MPRLNTVIRTYLTLARQTITKKVKKIKILPTRFNFGLTRLAEDLTIFAGRSFEGIELTEDIRSRTTEALTRICSDDILNYIVVVAK